MENGGGVERLESAEISSVEIALERAQGPGVQESQCIIMILWRLHGASK